MRASKQKDVKNSTKYSDPKLKVVLIGAPGEIRTPDRLVRSQVLYPAELRAHGLFVFTTMVESENRVAEREGFEPSKGY